MSLLAKATSGVIEGPKVTCIYGVNKIGKTSFVAEFPNHIILDLEKGSNAVSKANRIQKDDWTSLEIHSVLDDLLANPQGYKTLGIDSVEALADVFEREICEEYKVKSIAEVPFGKGSDRSRVMMTDFLKKCLKLKSVGVQTFLIGHAQAKQITDAMTDTQYDRWSLRASEKMAAVILDLSDNILFVCREIVEVKKNGQEVAFSDNQPYIYTTWTKGAVAGNRSNLPTKLPLDYNAYVLALELGKTREKSIDEIRAETAAMIEGLDKDTRPKAEENLKKAKTKEEIIAIKNRVNQLIAA